jgi:hypothetical protein
MTDEFLNSAPSSGGADASPTQPGCGCRLCLDKGPLIEVLPGLSMPATMSRMVLCPTCGNKRCPHATSHSLACTNSNEPGQAGSAYA